MESISSNVKELVIGLLNQIDSAITDILVWNQTICCAEDYLSSVDGSRNLAATSMMLEAIGEGCKRIDKLTNGELFVLKPNIPWKQVKGLRDQIAHGYFDIDEDIIWQVVDEDLVPLQCAIRELKEFISGLTSDNKNKFI
ncbi:MAG: DUF86 domain-containing protein [Paludibacteraceae bacterium]|nr:DUF86 domain-containing protein [Paludibacteraceae bacterium]